MPNPNELTLIFGPSVPASLEAVGLAFISAPTLKHDSAVALLSAERYVKENYPHIRSFPLHTQSTTASATLTATYKCTSVLGLYPRASFGFSVQGPIPNSEDYAVQTLQSPISVQGLYLSRAGSWMPIIRPGCVWRYHIVKAEEFNPGTAFDANGAPVSSQVASQYSWLGRSGLKPGDEVILIYTVPEHRYGALTTSSSTTFPGSQAKLRPVIEMGAMVSPTKISYRTPFKVLTRVTVNNVVKFAGSFDNTSSSTFISSINHDLQQIELKESLSPDDEIELRFLTMTEFYQYSGFRLMPTDTWYPFDANPEFGHYIGDPATATIKSSSECLLQQVTLYCIPSAYIKINYGSVGENTNVNLTFVSAFSWGESFFVRHIIGQSEEDIQTRQQDGPTNTWGHAVLGRNFYDEAASYPDDVYSLSVPSMMPLGKIVMAAPASHRSVQIADIRERGGGVPVDYPLQAFSTNASGIDYMRSFLDLGIWEGAAIKEGGVLEIHISSSFLNTFTADQIYEIVRNHMKPGIDFEIIYRDDV